MGQGIDYFLIFQTCQGKLLIHVLLCPGEGKVANVDPAPEWKIDVSDGEQDQRDEQGEAKYLKRVESGIDRTEH